MNKLSNILNDLDMILTDIMDKNKMIFPKVIAPYGLEKVKQRMGIDEQHS